jgi:hypothetical protein
MYLILYVDRVNIFDGGPADQGGPSSGSRFRAFAYPYALLQLLGGYFGDKFGPRLMLCVSLLIVCAATAATGAAGGLASLFAARLALGIGEGATGQEKGASPRVLRRDAAEHVALASEQRRADHALRRIGGRPDGLHLPPERLRDVLTESAMTPLSPFAPQARTARNRVEIMT